MDIQTFLTHLTSSPPKAPHSVDLEVDVDGDPAALFEVLLTLFIGILKKNYPAPINIGTISEHHIQECAEYFASFGIRLDIAIEPIPRVLHINNKAYETKTDLKDMKFQMTGGSNLYTLTFGFL
jgi:hypothetical protein